MDFEDADYVTNPAHGGKVTCHKCNGFILRKDIHYYEDNYHFHNDFEYFHKNCFNPYEHYYGLDKPMD